MTEQGPKARRIGMLALSVATALALAPAGAWAARVPWSTPVNDATGKPMPIALPATTAGFIPAAPTAAAPAPATVANPVPVAPVAPSRVALAANPPSALPVGQPGVAVAAATSGRTGVPVGVTGLPEIPAGDVLVITARAPARGRALSRRDLTTLRDHIQRLLSPAGTATVSYAQHAITVRDTPARERDVEHYLARINRHPADYGYRLRYRVLAPAMASAPAKPKPPYTLKAGQTLSHALAQYVAAHGWTLVWNVRNDYVLSQPFPIPRRDGVIAGVSYVMKAYQAQGGLLGDAPVFAMPNHVVVIKPMTVSLEQSR